MKPSKMRHALEASSGVIVALIEAGSLPAYLTMQLTNKETGEDEELTLMDIIELATNAMADEDREQQPDPLADHPQLF